VADLAVGKADAKPAGKVTALPGARIRRRQRRWVRPALIGAGPLVLALVGTYLYLTSGRFVSTDNAYVRADITQISTDVAGRVKEVRVHENDSVRAGQILFRLKADPFRFALEHAEAQLAQTRLEIEAMRATYAQKQAEIKAAQDTLDWQSREFERQQQLMATRVTTQQLFDQARHNVDAARQNLDSSRQALANILASLGGDPKIETDKHPRVLAAKAQVDQAELDLEHTAIYAPTDGTVAQVDKLHDGEYVNPGTPLFSVIGKTVWVEANFKETELTHMRPGQEATIDIDTYPGHTCTGTVSGISPGTGSEFSVLPPQNATGNWVKVVQRLPVRVAITSCDADLPLRSGMSAVVEVDTKYRRPAATYLDDALALIPGRGSVAAK
jgi:membrane fusion protein (multidrug efflux system)